MAIDPILVARGWLGTPYQHGASVRGVGADCLGLIRGVWREIYGAEPELVPAYAEDRLDAVGDGRLCTALMRHLLPVEAARAGDVVLFPVTRHGCAKHLGVFSDLACERLIHAYSRIGVVETPVTGALKRRAQTRFFRFPCRSR